jgi:hypothetical protein
MSTIIKAVVHNALLVSVNTLDITAKTTGKNKRTYKFLVVASEFLLPGETPADLKKKPLELMQYEDGSVTPISLYSSSDSSVPKPEPVDKQTHSGGGSGKDRSGKDRSKVLQSLDEYEQNEDNLRKSGAKGGMRLSTKKTVGNGISCPNCGEELEDGDYSSIRLTTVPTIAIMCVCGYEGRRSM